MGHVIIFRAGTWKRTKNQKIKTLLCTVQGSLNALQEITLFFSCFLLVFQLLVRIINGVRDIQSTLTSLKNDLSVALRFFCNGCFYDLWIFGRTVNVFPGSGQTAGATLIFYCLLDKYILACTSSHLLEDASGKKKRRNSTGSSRTTTVLTYIYVLIPDSAVKGVVYYCVSVIPACSCCNIVQNKLLHNNHTATHASF